MWVLYVAREDKEETSQDTNTKVHAHSPSRVTQQQIGAIFNRLQSQLHYQYFYMYVPDFFISPCHFLAYPGFHTEGGTLGSPPTQNSQRLILNISYYDRSNNK